MNDVHLPPKAASNQRDTLYAEPAAASDFAFTEQVVEVFDDMLHRSVPFYQEVIAASAQLLDSFLADGDRVYDLGCATGTTLLELSRRLSPRAFTYIGLDSSPAMLEKARLKAQLYTGHHLHFVETDITKYTYQSCGACLIHYTLQFIRPLQRLQFLQRLSQALRPGGILLLSEKVICHDSHLNREFINRYIAFKKSRGYSELEIAQKREALENVLIPFSISENCALLREAGFTSAEPFFQWFNFASFIAIKAS